MVLFSSGELIVWLRELPYFYEAERQIFVHTGIDEETDACWPWATPKAAFLDKYPAGTGKFYKDIVAGHIGACRLAGNPTYHGVCWDGLSYYYIDGSIQSGGRLNILVWNERGYRQWDGGWKEVHPCTDKGP